MILLDTDICIELLRGNSNVIEKRLNNSDDIAISFMTIAELFYGAENSTKKNKNISLINDFLLTVNIIHTDVQILRKFGEIKSQLFKENQLLPDADILIAAAALEKCTKLITGNIKHFKRIEELKIENWSV